jgi:hypothetical protein
MRFQIQQQQTQLYSIVMVGCPPDNDEQGVDDNCSLTLPAMLMYAAAAGLCVSFSTIGTP